MESVGVSPGSAGVSPAVFSSGKPGCLDGDCRTRAGETPALPVSFAKPKSKIFAPSRRVRLVKAYGGGSRVALVCRPVTFPG